ncbi:MAG: amidohydrolase [SAR202 cluster bacterium]|nr:amidohydrolase [SAR202 cluster bacterium]
MRSIDIHAHFVPPAYWNTVDQGKKWHGIGLERDKDNVEWPVRGPYRNRLWPMDRHTLEERISDMSSKGVDVQVLSTIPAWYYPEPDAKEIVGLHKACNDEVAKACKAYPQRYAGLAIIPMQDVKLAITELERSVTKLGLKGAMISDHIRGKTLEEPHFRPFWKAAEEMGALIFIHQGGPTVVDGRTRKYHLPNSIGNLVERSITYACLVFGGVMDQHPKLKVCLAHGGGYVCYGVGRMDAGWRVRQETRGTTKKTPSSYLRKFYYDCLTHSEASLRLLIDTVGADRVVLGSDYPADMGIDWPTTWILSMDSLTREEKEKILYKNLEKLLSI